MMLYLKEWRWRKNSSSQQGILNRDKVGKLDKKRAENDAEDTTGTQYGPGSSAAGEDQGQLEQGEREREETWGSLVWEDEAPHFKKEEKQLGIWGLLVKKKQIECRMFSDKYYDELWLARLIWPWYAYKFKGNTAAVGEVYRNQVWGSDEGLE